MNEEMVTYWFNKMYELGIIHKVLGQGGCECLTHIKVTS